MIQYALYEMESNTLAGNLIHYYVEDVSIIAMGLVNEESKGNRVVVRARLSHGHSFPIWTTGIDYSTYNSIASKEALSNLLTAANEYCKSINIKLYLRDFWTNKPIEGYCKADRYGRLYCCDKEGTRQDLGIRPAQP
jgi:hypothetical protein